MIILSIRIIVGTHHFDFTVITIHTKPPGSEFIPNANTKLEIDELNTFFDLLVGSPRCYSGNAIIMGDFNQGTNYIGASHKSTLDVMTDRYTQLMYEGGTTVSSKDKKTRTSQKHDR